MSNISLKGRTAFVSGASSGIGEAAAKMLASNGVNITIAARRIERLNELKKYLEKEYKVRVNAIMLDVTKKEEIIKTIGSMEEEWKNIDILINNAGLAIGKEAYYNQEIDDALNMISANCEGLITVTRLFLPFILKSKYGHIVNLSSTAADSPYFGGAIYCATKSFVDMFADSLRIELMDKPIKVTNIKPGAVNTEFSTVRFKGDKSKADEVYAGFDPLYAEDIADNIEYALTRKAHVQIASITTMALNQGSASMIYRGK